MFAVLAALTLGGGPALAGEPHPTRLIVTTHAGAPLAARDLPPGASVSRWIPEIGVAIVETQPGTLAQARAALAASPRVTLVELDFPKRLAYDPNDPFWPNMWHFRNLNVHQAWDVSRGSPAVVAVIDTGLEVTHEDLRDNVWVNADEVAGNGIDDDANGYVDDVNGWDFVSNDNTLEDNYGHGTPCAGIVGAVQDNRTGVTGVAPRARLMGIKACNDSGYLYDSYLIPAYVYAADNGAQVFSCSFFSDRVSAGERVAMEYAVSRGVIPVVAAGNSDSVIPYYPGAYECVIGVAAVNGSNQKSWFSNWGSWVDVAAPGEGLWSTSTGNGYTSGFGGTSGATPHIAGIVALLKGAKGAASAAEIRAALEDTATNLDQPPYGEFSNYGLANARAAMDALLGTPAPRRSPVVRYVTPMTSDVDLVAHRLERTVARIYGRGFQTPGVVEVTAGGRAMKVVGQTRDYVDFILLPLRGDLVVKVDGSTVATIPIPNEARTTYAAVEASSPGTTVTGSFRQMLSADGSSLAAGRNGDGNIVVQSTFRRVRIRGGMELVWKRRYTQPGGTETVYLYDWSTGSYPYGQWSAIRQEAAPTTATEVSVPLTNPSRFLDPEGTVYGLVVTSGTPGGTQLELDRLNLRRR